MSHHFQRNEPNIHEGDLEADLNQIKLGARRKTIVKLKRALFQIVVLFALALASSAQSPAGGVRSTPIGIGDVAPGFTLPDQSGREVTLSDARRTGPVVLVFYRGYW